MDEEVVRQIVDEVFSSLEPLDTQGAALTEFLKAKGIVSDEELAPFLKQAGNTSSVRWLAAKVRIKSMISSAMKDGEKKPERGEATEEKEELKASNGDSAEKPSEDKTKAEDAKDSVKEGKDGKGETEKERENGNEAKVTKGPEGSRAEPLAPAAEENDDRSTGTKPGRDVDEKEKVA